jgi:hypothetical protein
MAWLVCSKRWQYWPHQYLHFNFTNLRFIFSLAHYIGQVRLIFKLPIQYQIPDPLVYIHRFRGPTSTNPLKLVNMYRVERERYTAQYDHHCVGEIIPLSRIRRTCHLIPVFGRTTPVFSPSSGSALDSYNVFYVNSYLDLHSFQMLY